MSGSLDFLFLDPDLDDLLLLELLELLLLRDQEVFFVGSGLLGDGVEGRGHRLVVDDVGGEGGRGLDDLVLEEFYFRNQIHGVGFMGLLWSSATGRPASNDHNGDLDLEHILGLWFRMASFLR